MMGAVRGLCLAVGVIAILGCSRVEQPPVVTRAEYAEVQGHLWPSSEEAGWGGYFESDRGRSLVAKRARQVIGDRGASILRGATKVESFRIADTSNLDYAFGRHKGVVDTLGRIEGYTITSRGKDMGMAFSERLSAFLLDGRHYFMGLDCLPDPEVAFRARLGEESVTIVICFNCEFFKVFVHDSSGSIVHQASTYFADPFGDSKALTELAKESFPEDAEIQALGR